MVLQNYSDAVYQVVSGARSQAGGYIFLGNREENT